MIVNIVGEKSDFLWWGQLTLDSTSSLKMKGNLLWNLKERPRSNNTSPNGKEQAINAQLQSVGSNKERRKEWIKSVASPEWTAI